MSCPFCETCAAFDLFKTDPRLDYLRWAFCHGEHCDCERYKRLHAGETVAESFMPTGEQADRQVAKSRVQRFPL